VFESVNPATGEVIARYAPANDRDIAQALERAASGARAWSALGFAARAGVLQEVAARLRANAQPLAQCAAREMGKPVAQGRAEVEKCALLCSHFALNGEAMLAGERHDVEGGVVELAYAPLGVIFSITPWNFPFWQIMRAAVPTMISGNAVLNKPAPNVIGCARALAAIFAEAGAPPGALQCVPMTEADAGRVIADAQIAGVALTGSERAGAAVAAQAGHALKKSVLELGGSDPFIVLADADLEAAAAAAARSRFSNAGQVCIASKRLIVEAPVRKAFEAAFLAAAATFVPGDPLEEAATLGPMARRDLRDALDALVVQSVRAGAQVLLAGGPLPGPGHFYAPVVLGDAPAHAPVLSQETFGPAAALITAQDADDAITIANRSPFGLSANLWTADLDRARRVADRIESGGVFINAFTASDPRFPFGGVKRSGYGRELGVAGAREFTNLKTIWIAKT
jgi:succinate-semialdehyde dehydrogenase